MSIEQSTNAIARRDANDRASRVTTESEAIQLIARAQAEGDYVFVEALRAVVARKWPLPVTNWREKLTSSNKVITDIFAKVRADARLKQIGLDRSQAKISVAYAREEVKKVVDSRDWFSKLDALESEASKVSEKASLAFDKRFLEMTSIKGDVNAQLLGEMRATKEWERIKREIDGIESGRATHYLSDIFTNGTLETRYAVKTEAPSYMRSRGFDVDELLIDALALSDSDLGAARHEMIQASKYADSVRWNVRTARKRLEQLDVSGRTSEADDEAGLVRSF